MFLTEQDYTSQLRENDLADITNRNENVRTDTELKAQAEMESYLRDKYDVAEIFSATDNQRNPLIVMLLVDVTIYHMYSAVVARTIPQMRINRYEAALRWLEMVRSGKLNPDLPLIENISGNAAANSIIRSNERNGYGW